MDMKFDINKCVISVMRTRQVVNGEGIALPDDLKGRESNNY